MITSDNEFGGKLSELRKENELSQEELAEKLNVTRQTVSSWERNKSVPDISTLTRLCLVLGVSVDELVRGSYRTFTSKSKHAELNNNSVQFTGGSLMTKEIQYQVNKYDSAIGLGYAVSLFLAPILFSLIFVLFRSYFNDALSIGLLIASCICAFLVIGLVIQLVITLKR